MKSYLLINYEVKLFIKNDEEPDDEDFAPDGRYIPRILFIDRTGKVRKDIYNEAVTQYKYYYSDANKGTKSQKFLNKF